MAIRTLSGKTAYVNDKFIRVFGYSREDMAPGGCWAERAYPDKAYRDEIRARRDKLVKKAAKTNTEMEGMEVRVVCKDGTVKTVVARDVLIGNTLIGVFEDVTARIEAQETLRESEATMRAIFTQSPVAMVVVGPDGRTERVNVKFTRTFGYRLEDIPTAGCWMTRAFPGKEQGKKFLAKWEAQIKKAIATNGEIPQGELRVTCKDGTEKIALGSGMVTAEKKVIILLEDITAKVEAQEALRKSEATMRRILDQSPVAMVIHDQAGNFEYVNDKFTRVFGYRREDVPNLKRWTERAYPDKGYRKELLAYWARQIKRSIETNKEMDGIEVTLHCKNGMVKTAFITGVVTEDKKVVSLVEDVTARVQAEKALWASEARYRTLVETTGTGYVIIDGRGKVLDANREYVRLTGYKDLKEILGRPVTDWTVPHEKKKNAAAVRQCAADGHIRNFEVEYLGPSGKVTPIEVNATVVEMDGALRVVTVCRDISERRLAREEIEKLNVGLEQRVAKRTGELSAANRKLIAEMSQRVEAERAKEKLQEELQQAQKMEAIGRLAGGLAHDFNNILGLISGYAEFLLNSMPEGAPARGDLSEILLETQKGAALTRQLLAVGRKQPVQPRVLDLNTIVAEAEKMLRRVIGKNIRLETLLTPCIAKIMADPGQISQVIMNLVINSRDAMPDGGKIIISTGSARIGRADRGLRLSPEPGEYVMLSVRDTGAGMDAHAMSRIFEPFYTTKAPGKGTGLGLPTVYGIVGQAKGGISVKSEPGKGAEFKIYFPRTTEA